MSRRILLWSCLLGITSLAGCGCDGGKPAGVLQTGKQKGGDSNLPPELAVDDKVEISKDAREIANKRILAAIDAHGQKIGQTRMRREIMKGAFSGIPAEQEITLSLPDSIRNNIKLRTPMGEQTPTIVVHGSSGWRADRGEVVEMPENEIYDIQNELYYLWVLTLRPLLFGGFDLRPLEETKFRDRPMIGVRVTRIPSKEKKEPPRAPINLWFDKETKLLSRIAFVGREAGQQLVREVYFSEFKTFNDVKLATHIEEYRNGAPFLEWVGIEYEILDKMDESKFQRPK